MSEYAVTIPFAGHVEVYVEADSEEDAKEKAWDKLNNETEFHIKDEKEVDDVELVEFEFYDKLVSGNVCYVSRWEVDVDKVD